VGSYHRIVFAVLERSDIFSADTKATPASVQAVGIDFWFLWILLLQNVVSRVVNRTAIFRFVFISRDVYGF
jgi:hypothetical protein